MPRTADGQPDIQGVWTAGGGNGCSLETQMCPEFFQGRPGRTAGRQDAKSIVIDPPDGLIPFQEWAAARRRLLEKHVDAPLTLRGVDSRTLCMIQPPRANSGYPVEIFQTPGFVVMMWEWNHIYRVIPLTDRPHVSQDVKLLMGDARGRWEGNTLIVETANLNDWGWLDMTGAFHSNAMRLVERFSLIDPDNIEYQVTIHDPVVFTRPWTIVLPVRRSKSGTAAMGAARSMDPFAGEQIEHACVEGERAASRMLGAGRMAR